MRGPVGASGGPGSWGAAEGRWHLAEGPEVGSAPAVGGLLLSHNCVTRPAAPPPWSQAHRVGSGGVSRPPGSHWHLVSKGCFWGNRRPSLFWVSPPGGQCPQKQRRKERGEEALHAESSIVSSVQREFIKALIFIKIMLPVLFCLH